MAKPSLNYYQTMQVAEVKTDVVQFTTITAAIAAITARGAPATGKRWAVYVHPGTYDEQVTMVDWVDVVAIGGREETVIDRTASADNQPTVTGANAMIKGFTIVSDGTTNVPRCVQNATDGFEIDDCVLQIDNTSGTPIALLATNSMEIRNSQIDTAAASTTAVSLDTDTETYSIHNCLIGGGTNSLLVNDCLTLVLTVSTLTNLFDHDDCDTSTIIRDSILEEIDFDGGTLFEMHHTYVETIAANTGGTVIAYGGTIRTCTSVATASFVWWENDESLRVLPNMLIANALTAGGAASTATENVTIHLEAATYIETGMTLADDVNIVGVGHEETIITSAGGGTIFASGAAVICTLKDLQVSETNSGVCLNVTGAGAIVHCHGCEFNSDTDSITMVNGTLWLENVVVTDGDIEISTAACALNMYDSRMVGTTTGAINTAAENLAHTLVIVDCDLHGGGVDSGAVGAASTTTLDMRGCSNVGKLTNDGIGDWTIRDSDVQDCETTNTGDITIFGGDVGTCTAAAANGDIVWWKDTNLIYVLPAMLILHAVRAAGATGDTIRIGQGTWAENNIVVEKDINFIGEGLEASVVSDTSANPIFQPGDVTTDTAIVCTFQGLRIQNLGAGEAIELVAGSNGALGTTVVARECLLEGGTANAVGLAAAGDSAKSFEAFETSFEALLGNCIDVDATVAAVISLHNCEFLGGAVADLTGANHNFDAWDTECGGGAITVAGNAPTIELTRCNDVGAITNLTGAMVLEHCTTGDISTTTGGVTIEQSNIAKLSASGAATVNVYNSHITEAEPAAGTFSFYECYLVDIDANGGTVTVYGGTIEGVSDSSNPIRWLVTDDTYRVITGMLIQHAIDHGTAGKTILVGPGTFTEALSFAEATDEATLIGEGTDKTIIYQSNGTPVTLAPSAAWAGALCIENLTIQGAAMDNDYLVHVNSATAAASLVMRGVVLTGARSANNGYGLYTSGDENNTVELRDCNVTMTGAATTYAVYSATDGVNTYTILMRECHLSGATDDLNLTTDCTTTSYDCTYATGGITLASDAECILRSYNDTILATITKGALAIMTCQTDLNEWIVHNGMEIADALASAVAGDTVLLRQGTFAENSLAPATGVDIVGEGQEVSQIVDTSANPIFAIGNNISVTIRAVQISNAGTGGAFTVSPVANASAVVLEDCDVVNAGASDCVTVSIGGAGSGTLTARRTAFTSDGANSIVVLAQTAGAGLLYFNSTDCNFTTSGGAANAAIEASAAVVADVNVKRATFSGCTLAVYSTGANHTIDIDESDFTTCGIELAGNVPVVRLQECYDIGAVTHSVACTVTLYGCQLSDTYTIGAVAGVVNAYQTRFATFTNGGSGAITFEDCSGGAVNNNSTSAMSIQGGDWGAVTQGAAAGTISMYNTISGDLSTGAAGTIALYGHCQFSDIAANAGILTWAPDATSWKVVKGTADMNIIDAADAASAGDLIEIGPGTFSEALDLDAAGNVCTYRGMGRDKTIITATGNTVLVDGIGTAALPVVFEDLTIIASDGGDGEYGLLVNSTTAIAAATLRNVTIDMTGDVGAVTVHGLRVVDGGVNVGTVVAFDCYIEATTGGTANYAVSTATTVASTITMTDCALNGTDYDIYNNYLTCTMHSCQLTGGGAYIANNAAAICLAFDNEAMTDPTPVVFAGANGVFADLSGCEVWTTAATINQWVYVSAADTLTAADADGADTHPSVGVIVYKLNGTGYLKKHGYLYKPNAGWTAGAIEYLSATAGAETETRPVDGVIQILGVAKATTTMLVDVELTDGGLAGATKWINIPIAWGAGSAPTGTHVDGNSRRAVAIAVALQTVFGQAITIPKDFQAFSKLIVSVIGSTTGSFDWTAYSSAASNGEDEATHSDSATADTQAVTDDQILDHDISAAADGYTMVQGDVFSCSLLIDVLTTTTQLNVLGFRLEYIPTK